MQDSHKFSQFSEQKKVAKLIMRPKPKYVARKRTNLMSHRGEAEVSQRMQTRQLKRAKPLCKCILKNPVTLEVILFHLGGSDTFRIMRATANAKLVRKKAYNTSIPIKNNGQNFEFGALKIAENGIQRKNPSKFLPRLSIIRKRGNCSKKSSKTCVNSIESDRPRQISLAENKLFMLLSHFMSTGFVNFDNW